MSEGQSTTQALRHGRKEQRRGGRGRLVRSSCLLPVLEMCSLLATQGLVPVGVTHPICTPGGQGTVRVAVRTPRPLAGLSLGSLPLAGSRDLWQLVFVLGTPAFSPVQSCRRRCPPRGCRVEEVTVHSRASHTNAPVGVCGAGGYGCHFCSDMSLDTHLTVREKGTWVVASGPRVPLVPLAWEPGPRVVVCLSSLLPHLPVA